VKAPRPRRQANRFRAKPKGGGSAHSSTDEKNTERSRPTIPDVAALAGVSVSTAARALAGKGYSSVEARTRVLDSATKIGYVPNYVARSLRLQRTNIIGLLIADVENSFYAGIAKNVEAVATKAGYSVVLCNSSDEASKEKALLDLLEGLRIAALIITPTGANRTKLEQLQQVGMTIVQIDRLVPGLRSDAVLVDNELGAYEAVSALIAAGHRHIGLLAGAQHLTTGHQRSDGYVRALRDHGLPIDRHLMRGGSFRRDHALDEARALLASPPPITAIFAANNILAEASLIALKERALQVPRDVSLVAFDDVEWMRTLDRGITAVQQPVADMARAACEMILKRLAGNEAKEPSTDVYRPHLILRDSVAAPRSRGVFRSTRTT
jgi:LacI family transcriptional regulator, galactose operon repressor